MPDRPRPPVRSYAIHPLLLAAQPISGLLWLTAGFLAFVGAVHLGGVSGIFMGGFGAFALWLLVRVALRGVRRVDVRRDGLVVWPLLGRRLQLGWEDVERVRPIWGLGKTLSVSTGPRHRTLVFYGSHLRGFDEFYSLLLDHVSEGRVDRSQLTLSERLWMGSHVPTHEDENRDEALPASESRRRTLSAMLAAALGVLVTLWILWQLQVPG